MSSWANLPSELLEKCIKLNNPNFAEVEELRRVNVYWRESLPSFRGGGLKEKKPWLLYHQLRSGECRFYDTVRGRIYQRRQPDPILQNARFLGSSAGFLLLTSSIDRVEPLDYHEVFLYNPFTLQRYDLPPLKIQPPNLKCVVRYGVVTGDLHGQENTYVCLLADNFFSEHMEGVAYWKLYYVAKSNGEWDQNWSEKRIPAKHYFWKIDSVISPSTISVIIRPPIDQDPLCYEFNLQNEHWNTFKTEENDLMEWDPFKDQNFTQLKELLDIPIDVRIHFNIIGTKTDCVSVKNRVQIDDDGWVSSMEGVWVEVRA